MRLVHTSAMYFLAGLGSQLAACCGPECQVNKLNEDFVGGGQDAITANLPFDQGYSALCTQGANGAVSHLSTSTKYDVDLDTSNLAQEPVFAPIGGVAYVHVSGSTNGFGTHINIDLGDGTYVILGHLSAAFVASGEEVAAGQILGFEGSTGKSFGDHVHYGRHAGDAALDGLKGVSFDGLMLDMDEAATGNRTTLMTTAMQCALPGGKSYRSRLETPRWHPDGSLLKTPDQATVYLVEDGRLTPFVTESSFVSRNYSFAEVTIISQAEKACYSENAGLATDASVTAVYGSGSNAGVWLLVGDEFDDYRYRLKVPVVGWQAVLRSWGLVATTEADLFHDVGGLVGNYPYGGVATFRDGALISAEDSAVYIMANGVALPIDSWDTLLFAGWGTHTILEVQNDEFTAAVTVEGDCSTNTYCFTRDDVVTCGGPEPGEEGVVPVPDPTEVVEDVPPIEVPADGPSDVWLTWVMPDNAWADSLVLVGAVTRAGQPEDDWGTVFNEVLNATAITAVAPALSPGDSVRFSVQYWADNADAYSWSCLAPYPPGHVQGTVLAERAGVSLPFTVTSDPWSLGCGLQVSVPWESD